LSNGAERLFHHHDRAAYFEEIPEENLDDADNILDSENGLDVKGMETAPVYSRHPLTVTTANLAAEWCCGPGICLGWARVGNSIPPLFVKAIAEHIRRYLLSANDSSDRLAAASSRRLNLPLRQISHNATSGQSGETALVRLARNTSKWQIIQLNFPQRLLCTASLIAGGKACFQYFSEMMSSRQWAARTPVGNCHP
jgi:hypothetical protein